MQMSSVMSWFGRPVRLEPPVPLLVPDDARLMTVDVALPTVPSQLSPAWSPGRLTTTDSLWGEGYQFPGGEAETLRLAKPLGLSAASSLLMLGAGAGGPACSVATQLGAWVSGFEADPDLMAAALDRIARRNLTRRAQIETWDPSHPVFRKSFYHHGLALEALHGNQPERILSAVAHALKPSGHLMMVELVADKALDPDNPIVAAWARLERRDPTTLPRHDVITRILGRLGFDVRVVEDVSERYIHNSLSGWRSAVQEMEEVRPSRRQAMRYVDEAELWLLRLRLFQPGWLRMMRWHGIGRG
jgi:cyclopropane fatty-acyl-phospholipid synthase-like methyltransferase